MDDNLGVLKIRVRKGINLAVRDSFCSDPYVVITMAGQVCYFFFISKEFSFYALQKIYIYINNVCVRLILSCKENRSSKKFCTE